MARFVHFGLVASCLLCLTITACNNSGPAQPAPVASATAMAPPGVPAPPGPGAARRDSGNAPTPPPGLSESFILGNPDGATGDPENRNRLLLIRKQFAASYNDSLKFPNWVGWHLSESDIGNVERGSFRPDPELPEGFLKVTPTDYTGSGYDRGHNVPSKDRSVTRQDNDAVFVMTNITPQQHGMNGGPWNGFEEYCRDLTRQGNELYIYCGHGFTKKSFKRIGKAGVAIPDFGWKIAVVLPEQGGNDLARITPETRVIAVRMPNISTIINEDWRKYKVSVAEIEGATGLTFFTSLPTDVAAKLKTKVDFEADSDPVRGGSHGRRPGGADTDPTSARPPAGGGAGKVWVNTRSGVYWLPGTEFYGKTKQGKYMTEAEATRAGYRKAGGQ